MIDESFTTSLVHHDLGESDDELKEKEARQFFGRSPHLQFIASLYGKLREVSPTWWSPEFRRDAWTASARMRWLVQRPDIRQRVTTRLTGLAAGAARRFFPDEQATLIDAVIDSKDVSLAAFDDCFDPQDLATYGDAIDVWRKLREQMPWDDASEEHQRLVAWLVRAVLTERTSPNAARSKPILDAWEVRTAIQPEIFQRFIPIEIRVALDEARLKHEKARPREPFSAKHELAIVTPERLTACLPLIELAPIFDKVDGALAQMARAPLVQPVVEDARPSQVN